MYLYDKYVYFLSVQILQNLNESINYFRKFTPRGNFTPRGKIRHVNAFAPRGKICPRG